MEENRRLRNLKPASVQTPEERRENGRKGGKIGVEKKREKKLLRELASTFLTSEADEKSQELIHLRYPEITEKITNGLIMIVALHRKALKGDPKAFEVLRDTAGEKPSLDLANTDGSLSRPDLSHLSYEQLEALVAKARERT